MAISGGGTLDIGGGTLFWPVPAEFNHCPDHDPWHTLHPSKKFVKIC